jgi:VanZ family protein
MTIRRGFALWAPVVLWAGVIFGLSSIPSLSSGLGTWDEVLRKGAHLTEYAILGALLLRALGSVVPAFGLGILYAASDELHQNFVRGRHPSPFDVAFDACGLALGLLVALSVQSQRDRAEELRRPPAGRGPGTAGRAANRA